jgi:DnaJ-class molecular chaperone
MQMKKTADSSAHARKIQMKKLSPNPTEHKCPACNGTGFPTVMQPVRPRRKIYPAQYKKCTGKGRIAKGSH